APVNRPSAQACKKRTIISEPAEFQTSCPQLHAVLSCLAADYRLDQTGAGIIGLASAASAGKTTRYCPFCTCVIRTGCWFCPLSNLIGPNGVEDMLMFLMASRILAGSNDFALLMASAATRNAAYAWIAW